MLRGALHNGWRRSCREDSVTRLRWVEAATAAVLRALRCDEQGPCLWRRPCIGVVSGDGRRERLIGEAPPLTGATRVPDPDDAEAAAATGQAQVPSGSAAAGHSDKWRYPIWCT